MPKEMIIHPQVRATPDAEVRPGLQVGWNRQGAPTTYESGGWVQLSHVPDGWESTGDWSIVNLDRRQINTLIRTLRRARDAAFGSDA